MLFPQLFELFVQLLVPRVQHEDLEGERGGADDEVGEGEAAGEPHDWGRRSRLLGNR